MNSAHINCASAIVLAGGKGTRLAPLGLGVPKPMIPFRGRPLVSWIIDRLLRIVARVVLIVNRESESFAQQLSGDGRIEIILAPPLGTGFAVTQGARCVTSPVVVVSNGDTIVDFSLTEVLSQQSNRPSSAMVVLSRRSDAQNAGAFAVADNGQVLRSFEDGEPGLPPHAHAKWHGASTGIVIFPNDLLAKSCSQHPKSVERELLPGLIRMGALFAFDNGSRFCLDIGTPERLTFLYTRSNDVLAALARED